MAEQNRKRSKKNNKEVAKEKDDIERFPIVGIGSSAGGLEALESFFKNTLPESGLAYVLISHLDPNHPSILAELVGRFTSMEVVQATDGMSVMPNKVYVIPPGKNMGITNRTLQLFKRSKTDHELNMPIDLFFQSLAEDQNIFSIAIILSGNGSDGSFGLRSIQANLGLVMVQSPETAKYDGMPRSAITTGLADYVLPPSEMYGQLEKYIRTLSEKKTDAGKKVGSDIEAIYRIMGMLRSETGHDFSLYKRNTISRRIERRMAVHQLDTMRQYIDLLRKNPQETHMLFKELLIQVTKFFRDPEAFEALKTAMRSSFFTEKREIQNLRVWVPGCSTGEEVYSLAIMLAELMEETERHYEVQIFGTDIDDDAISVARSAEYPISISPDVGEERLHRYFTREEDKFKLKKEIRDMAIFAPQNIIRDPPFIRLDLISCRNLLIYFETSLQRKVLETMSFALNPGGVLLLGSSETVNGFTEEFIALDQKWKVYQRAPYTQPFNIRELGAMMVPPYRDTTYQDQPIRSGLRVNEAADRALLTGFAPPGLIVDNKDEIVYFHGKTSKYLEHPPGKASLGVQNLLREDIKYQVMAALRDARATHKVSEKDAVKVKADGDSSFLNIIVKPVEELSSIGGMLVVFQDVIIPKDILMEHQGLAIAPDKETYISELEKELSYTKESLQSTIEELETSNEELKSTNEELQSTNEELQSVAEESETAKEELHSLNEELLSVNAELEKRNDELLATNSDMKNLLNSIDVATIFLDTRLRIKRFTPQVGKIMNLISSDVGRPISDITMNLKYEGILADAQEVLEKLTPREKEIQTKDGRWYKVRLLPYRTVDNVIDGVVITVIDIDVQKKAQEKFEVLTNDLTKAREYSEGIVNTINEPLMVLDQDMRVVSMNYSFYTAFDIPRDQGAGLLLADLDNELWQDPQLNKRLRSVFVGKDINDLRVEVTMNRSAKQNAILTARKLVANNGGKHLVVTLSMRDG
jgi:two-component system, chemotaxis family, CheB/CheR fusion protein